MERETGVEPATSTLARSHSTTELLPLQKQRLHYIAMKMQGSNTTLMDDFHLCRCQFHEHYDERYDFTGLIGNMTYPMLEGIAQTCS